jgi:hypothetical protein
LAGETYSFRFCDSNIWYLKILIIYEHLKYIYKHNCNRIPIIIMLWKAQMQCLIEIVASQWSHVCHMPGDPHRWE